MGQQEVLTVHVFSVLSCVMNILFSLNLIFLSIIQLEWGWVTDVRDYSMFNSHWAVSGEKCSGNNVLSSHAASFTECIVYSFQERIGVNL